MLASAMAPPPPPLLARARASLAAAATSAAVSRGKVAANCMQVAKRGGTGAGGRGGRAGEGGGGAADTGGYGTAVVDVMGEGMETLTLPKLVLQGSGLEDVVAREEGYAVLARLRALGVGS